MIKIFFLIALLCLPILADPVLIDGPKKTYKLNQFIFYFEDKSNNLNLEDILKLNFNQEFKLNKKEVPSFGITPFVYWFYFEYEAKSKLGDYLLEIEYPLLDNISYFYLNTRGDWVEKKVGDNLPFAKREIEHRNFIFSMEDNNVSGKIFFKVKTDGAMQFPVSIHKQSSFWEKEQKFLSLQMIFLGIMAAMILYNALLGISLNDKTYFFYIFYLVSVTLFETSLNGISYQFFWKDFTYWNSISIPIFVALSNIGISAFVVQFLKVKTNQPLLYKIFQSIILFSIINVTLCFFISYDKAIKIAMLFTAVSSILSMLTAFIVARKGYRPAKIYLFAWCVFLFGATLLAFNRFQIVPVNVFTENTVQIGVAIESILISFALADRIKILQKEKEKAQEEYITLFNNLNVGAYRNTGGKRGEFLKANPAIARMFGYELDEFMKVNVADLYANPEERIKFVEMMKEKRECHKYELLLKRKDNTLFPASLTARIYYDSENKYDYMDGIIEDITEMKEAEKKLEKAQLDSIESIKKTFRIASELSVFKNEMDLAKKIQQSMIPNKTPVVEGFDIAAWYKPMESIGGDFYDFQRKGDFLGFIIADVSGHGVPAALIVSTFKTAFWFQDEMMPKPAFWFQDQNFPKPEILLSNMNKILKGKSGGEFVTACYGYIDIKRKILKTGNAGHSDLLIYRKKGEKIFSLNPEGAALCVFKDPEFKSEEFQLEKGDRIFLYTDGLFEVVNEKDEQFGEARLSQILRDKSELSAQEFGDFLLKTVIDWSRGKEHLEDDIALIVIDLVS